MIQDKFLKVGSVDFDNRVAVVTGGTGALGSAIALNLLRSGALVTVTYSSGLEWRKLQDKAGDLASRLDGVSVDLTRASDVALVVRDLEKRYGHIDFLLCIAGGFAAGKVYESDEATWDRMLNLNLRTLTSVLRCVVPLMIAKNFGRIVTVSAGVILEGGGVGMTAYAVSKWSVRHLSELLAGEVSAYDIRVFCLMPATMDTEANRRSMPEADFSRWVKTERVAEVVHDLLKDRGKNSPVVVPILR
jgi:NAD(P)-dependent dehydrogenase (short-subunit alcohol dehydrogenase family)